MRLNLAGVFGSRCAIWVVFVLVAVATPWCNIPRDQADDAGMMAHLHGAFVDGDMLYDDEYVALRMSPLFAFVTETGFVSNHWPVGATWLQGPGYVAGLAAAKLLAWLGVGRGDALGVVALLGVRAWAALVAGLVALGITRMVRRAGGSSRAAGLVTVAAVLGTPMLYYALESPLRPHLWACAVVLALVEAWRSEPRGNARVALVGVLAGLATCVRPQLAPLVLLALHAAWQTTPRAHAIVVALASFAVWPLLQLRVMLTFYDVAWPSIDGVTHHLLAFLTSPHHGLIPWTPVFVLGLVAMVRSGLRRECGAWILLALVVHQIWIDSGTRGITPFTVLGTRTWAGGVGFGARKMLDIVPLFLPAVISWVTTGTSLRRPIAVLAGLAVVTTAALHLAAIADPVRATGTLHDGTSYVALFASAVDPHGWAAAGRARALPLGVGATLLVVVTLPLFVALALTIRRMTTIELTRRATIFAAVIIGAGVIAHLWTSVLIVRSEAELADHPERTEALREPWAAAHRATLRRIPPEVERMRTVLGDHAVP